MKILDLLTQEIRASASYNSSAQVAPSVILWTDKLRQWQPALPLLQAALPELIVLGDYQPTKRQGPAIWIKCVIENTLPEIELPKDKTPIIYLPGIERRDLRAIAECPTGLMPLAELQYRGCWWVYSGSGRDWSVNAFLTSGNGGAGLDVARDEKSQQAMLRVLNEILGCEQKELLGRRLEAPDFNKLVSNDPVRDLLTWMNDSKGSLDRWEPQRWQALVGICETEYHFSPERDGELTAAELLCRRQGVWEGVWQRYAESCHHYSNFPQLLLKVDYDLAADGASYPGINKQEEEKLEQELKGLLSLDSTAIRRHLYQLEKQHAPRRQWIWLSLGLSPLAGVLEHLAIVADLTSVAFAGTTPDEMACQYHEKYWLADDHFLRALAYPLSPANQELVQALLGLTYQPWLESVTQSFQSLSQTKGYPGIAGPQIATKDYQSSGELVFFVDGLRFDIANRLASKLAGAGQVELKSDWAALPSVTATAKAAVTPVHKSITGRSTDLDFEPSLKSEDKGFSAYYFKKLLSEKHWAYLEENESGDIKLNAWTQTGDIDKEGHIKGIKLAGRIDAMLDEIVERIEDLQAAGWRKIRVVTDHGWILTPEPMKKVELPKYLTETRWGRCAVIKETVNSGFLEVNWYWNPQIHIAMAPGIHNFKAGQYYDHGGLSLQECFTPVITIVSNKPSTKQVVNAVIDDIRWVGLVCKVKVTTESETVLAVLRTHPADPDSEICNRKPVKSGKASLMVEDDQLTQSSAVLVLLDDQGNVLAKKPTLVGDE